ncbi:NAD(P)/FAD-dependent oxidoreductase [Nocardioides salarius]|uniref:NAD(P)/FAD-dependent oxidoreductase n=1 Tax=Nocardioides salarius TaxID=374513 RepID=UPI0030F5727D
MSARNIVIIGGGQASAVATRTLRRRGYDAGITIVGDEAERPYQRPPLSKEYLTAADESGLFLLPEDWTEAHDVDLRTGVRATKISAADGSVLLEDGTMLPADRVLLATGGSPRRLPDTHGDRILYLRTKADAARLREHVRPGARVIVIGAGFIGAEVASSARILGAEVTVLEAAPVPLARVLGLCVGEACAQMHVDAGVDLRLDTQVETVRQIGDEVVVSTSSGDVVGDVVVVGIGIVPNDEVARASGIDVDNGVLVDAHCRSSMEHVYAAGDVANHYHPLFKTRMRVEHFDNANKQAAAAANNMIGRETIFDDPHWFWSDQFGRNLQYVGHAAPTDQVVIRGDIGEPSWSAFYLRDGGIRAAFAVDNPEDIMVARELISARVEIDAARLGDSGGDLMELLEEL